MLSGFGLSAIVSFLGEAAADLIMFLITMTTSATSTDITGSGVLGWLGRFMGIGIPLVIMFSSLSLVSASVKSGGFAGWGLWFKNTSAGAIGLVLIEPFVILGDNLAEGISWAIVKVAGDDLTKPDALANAFSIGTFDLAGSPWLATMLLLSILVVIIASYIMLLVLSVRNVLLYFMVVVGAIAITGIAWEKTAGWPRKWISIMLGLLFAKLGVFLALAIGIGIWTHVPGSGGSTTAQVIGTQTMMAAVFIVAALAPFWSFKLFDFLGDGLANSLHQPTGAGRTLVNTASYRSRGLMSKINSNKTAAGAGKAAGAGAAGAAASKVHPVAAAASVGVKGVKKAGSVSVSEPLASGGSGGSGSGVRVSVRAPGASSSPPPSSPPPPVKRGNTGGAGPRPSPRSS